MCRFTSIAAGILTLAGCLCSVPAGAQRVIALTNSLSAVGAAASVYAESLDFSRGAALPGAVPLPGPSVTGRLVLGAKRTAWLTSGPASRSLNILAQKGRAFLSLLKTSPFAADGMAHWPVGPGWRARLVDAWPTAAGATALLLLEEPVEQEAGLGGRLRLLEARPTAQGLHELGLWEFPFTLLDVCRLAGYGAVVLHRASAGTGATLHAVAFPTEGGEPHEGVKLVEALASVEGSLAVSSGGGHIYALLSGYPIGVPTAGATSYLYRFDASTFGLPGEALTLSGSLPRGVPALYAGNVGDAWFVTLQTGAASTQVARATVTDDGMLTLRAQYSLSITEPGAQPHLAIHGSDVAVALGRRLEIWPGGERRGAGSNYPEPIYALAWGDSGLFAGESGRVHWADPVQGTPLGTVQLQSGRVVALMPLPPDYLVQDDPDGDGLNAEQEEARGTSAQEPDTDGDFIHDGIDPAPGSPSPRLHVPFELVFRGEAAGKQLRAIPFEGPFMENARWRLEYDVNALPWLVVNPRAGTGEGASYLTVNPVFYDPTTTVTGAIDVWLSSELGTPAAGSPARVQVRVDAAPSGARTVLWLLDEEEGPQAVLPGIVPLLSGPPFYLSHASGATPYQGRLEDYAIVVLSSQAASHGAITRQRLLDYVARGGAFLLIASRAGDTVRPLAQWLHTLGIQVASDRGLPGDYQIAKNPNAAESIRMLARHWPEGRLPDACIVTAPAENVAVGTADGSALLVAREFAYGRLAVLASTVPIAGNQPASLLFARTLFQWLQRAGIDPSDMDGDSLLDGVEDTDNNGAHDPGETNYLLADTDWDGVPDGMEDLNLNGYYDEGETDPRNPDSDIDGVLDGADPSPVPVVGSPVITSVDGVGGPSEGPAEGGTTIAIFGRNFTQDCTVWFGQVPAEEWRILSSETAFAVSPAVPASSEGLVPLRMVSGTAAGTDVLEGRLPDAFRYTPRSVVRIALEEKEPPLLEEGWYRGRLGITLSLPQGVAVSQLLCVVSTGTREAHWGDAEMEGASSRLPALVRESLGQTQFVLRSREGAGLYFGDVRLSVPWEVEAATLGEQPLRAALSGAFVLTRNGQTLNVEMGPPITLAPKSDANPAP